jgi:hypothetical protein
VLLLHGLWQHRKERERRGTAQAERRPSANTGKARCALYSGFVLRPFRNQEATICPCDDNEREWALLGPAHRLVGPLGATQSRSRALESPTWSSWQTACCGWPTSTTRWFRRRRCYSRGGASTSDIGCAGARYGGVEGVVMPHY